MKHSSNYILLIAVGILLQGCAGTVSPQGKSTQQTLEGSKKLSISTKQCPRGIGFVRLYRDTNDGSITKYNSKFNLTSKNIDKEFNAYNMVEENHPATLAKGEKSAAKGDTDTSNNSIVIKLSDQQVAATSARVGDATSLLANTDGTKAKVNDRVSIHYDSQKKYYKGWGIVENGALSEMDNDTINQTILQSVFVKFGKDESSFPIPETIDGPDYNLDQQFKATIGQPFSIKIRPKTYDVKGILYVQLNNGLKGAKNVTSKFIMDDGIGVGEIPVPTKDLKKGDYVINIFRSEIFPVDADEKTDGAQNFCMEVGTGIIGRLSVAEPEKNK